jgi:phenylalanyl-tRNA synthetase beta chain
MRAPLSWLRDFAPIDLEPAELAAVLDGLGLVVDAVDRIGPGLEDVVVARVVEINAIPGADRIRSVLVDAGDPVEVVCGAWNFNPGDLVPLAPVGAVLPGAPGPITRRKMKGALSNGMLCSGSELGLADDAEGLMILSPGLVPGTPLTEALGIASDVVFDLDVTPNRPDALSVAGVARDVAAVLRIPFSVPEVVVSESGVAASALASVRIEDFRLCPVFAARVLTDVAIGASPDWVASRLTLAGMRPINSVVDASNYVMLELGQPSHPYDLDLVGGRGLVVRAARPGEVVVTLDGSERQVGGGGEPDLLICDAEDRPVGLAGIMGGASSEISSSTRRVLLEVAHFEPMAIARTSKRLGLRSEASSRFERGTDPEIVQLAADRVATLAGMASPASVAAGTIMAGQVPERRRVELRPGRVNRLLGTDLDESSVRGYLEAIDFSVDVVTDVVWSVSVPGRRPDVTGEVDLIEEVARHHGYGRIPRTVPATTQAGGLTAAQRERRLVMDVMAGAGLSEVWTPSLLPAGAHAGLDLDGEDVAVANPMSRDEAVLRRSMLPGLLGALRFNAGHRNTDLRLFEVGRIFSGKGSGALPDEFEVVSAALYSGGDAAAATVLWRTLADALRLADPSLRSAVRSGLHPTRTARTSAGGVEVGWIGEVDPALVADHDLTGRVGWLEIDMAALARAPRRSGSVRPVSVYPTSDFDLAFLVAETVPASDVEDTLRAAAGDLLVDLWLFDVYRDPAPAAQGRRSLAWRLRLGALDRTLTDEDAAAVRQRCIRAVEEAHGAALRG